MARLEETIENAIKPILKKYEKIENDLLIKISSHFSMNYEFLNSDYWRIQKLDEMGLFNQDIIDYLSREAEVPKEKILEALKQIGIETVNLNNLNRLFEDEVLKIDPNVLVNDYVIQNIINSAYDELTNNFIQMSSKIQNSTREAYLNIVEEAYLKTSMGTHSYQEAIRTAIDDLSNKGLTILKYQTLDEENNVVGIRNYDIESAIRREVLTSTRQLANSISMEIANELNCEYLYLSEHVRCRPNHFDWQGTIIKKVDLVSVTDYGSITGLAGINCAHYFEPYFGDARGNDLKTISKEEATRQYKLSQKQRYLERGIRKWKRKVEMFKANEDVEACQKSRAKVREWQNRIIEFTNENKMRREYSREYVQMSSNSEINSKIKSKIASMKVGTFDASRFDSNLKTTTKDVILTPKQRKHIIDDHPDVSEYIELIPVILNKPDKVYLQLDKEDTLWITKTLDKEIKLTLKLNTQNNLKERGYKNSIIQMQIMKQNRISKYIEKGKIKELFAKK